MSWLVSYRDLECVRVVSVGVSLDQHHSPHYPYNILSLSQLAIQLLTIYLSVPREDPPLAEPTTASFSLSSNNNCSLEGPDRSNGVIVMGR